MRTELMYLVWVTALTGVMWIPYILDRLAVQRCAIGDDVVQKYLEAMEPRQAAKIIKGLENEAAVASAREAISRPARPATADKCNRCRTRR